MDASLAIQLEQILVVCVMATVLLLVWMGMTWLKDKARYAHELGLLVEKVHNKETTK